MKERELLIKQYSKKELAKMYNCDVRTIYRWIKKIEHKIGKSEGHRYSIKQVELILSIWDLPSFNMGASNSSEKLAA